MDESQIKVECLKVAQAWIAHHPMDNEKYAELYTKENLVKLAEWLAKWATSKKGAKQ